MHCAATEPPAAVHFRVVVNYREVLEWAAMSGRSGRVPSLVAGQQTPRGASLAGSTCNEIGATGVRPAR
jgi:hypothetical protein